MKTNEITNEERLEFIELGDMAPPSQRSHSTIRSPKNQNKLNGTMEFES